MANVEGENPNFDDLKEPAEEAVPAEPTDELAAFGEELAAELSEPENVPTGTENAEEASAGKMVAEDTTVRESSKTPIYLVWGVVIGIPVLVLLLALTHILYFPTAIYIISVALIPYGIWKGRETTTIYTVVLGCALAAVLTAIYFLWLEEDRYRFDVKAREAKQRVSASWSAGTRSLAGAAKLERRSGNVL